MTRPAPLPQYAWPPLLPDQLDDILAATTESLGNAWDEVLQRQAAVLADVTNIRREAVLATLDELQASVAGFRDTLEDQGRVFARRTLPGAYAAGAMDPAGLPTRAPFRWTQPHVDAVLSLSADSYGDFLERSREAGRTSDAFARAVRKAARTQLPRAAIAGRTGQQVARDLARSLERQGISSVTYRDGSRRHVRDWSEMATRTKVAVARNAGTLNRLHEGGVRFVEVFDGAACGWTAHGDGDTANGSIRTLRDAAAHPISHPRCRRGFGGRPDIVDETDAADAPLSTTADQRVDQATSEGGERQGELERARNRQRAARDQRRAERLAAPVDPLALVDLAAASDDELLGLMGREDVADSDDALERVLAELDRREQAEPIVDVAQAIGKGTQTADEAKALADYFADLERRDAELIAAKGAPPPPVRGARARQREEWELLREAQLDQAREATRGRLVNSLGQRAGVTEHALWDLPARDVVRYLSEELHDYFREDASRRLTYSQYASPNAPRTRKGREAFVKALQEDSAVERRRRARR